MKIEEKIMELLQKEADFKETEMLFEEGMKVKDIEMLKNVLRDLKIRYDYAAINSCVGKLMEEEKLSKSDYEKYIDEYNKNCKSCINEYLKSTQNCQKFIE